MREFITVDPATLHLPTGIRSQGADPVKLTHQIAEHGNSLDGMPALENDGVTRATRAAKLRPGELVPAEVIATYPKLDVTKTPRVGDTLP